MVYTSPSLALACVETYVHIDPSLIPDDFVYVIANIPDHADIERVELESLPADWRAIDHQELKSIGAKWIGSGRSLCLEVPSAAVEGEWNILLNPSHPNYRDIVFDPPVPWKFDDRMFQKNK